MALKKRLSALILALVMVSSVSVTAFALTEDEIMEEYGLLKHEYIDYVLNPVTPFVLPGTADRTARFWSSIAEGHQVFYYYDDANEPYYSYGGSYATTYENYRNVLAQLPDSRYYSLNMVGGACIDYTSVVDYKVSEYKQFDIVGNLVAYMLIEPAGNGNGARANPTGFSILINGEEVSEKFTLTNGSYTGLEYSVSFEEDVTSIGYRFYYDSSVSGSGQASSVVPIYLKLAMDDALEFTPVVQDKDVNTGLLEGILDWIIGIYNSVFVPDSQKDDADAFQNEVSDTVAGADEVKDELDQLEKPDPEDIDTDLSDIVTESEYTQQTQIFADLLRFDKITDMLMIVFTMALISYVLFGKKG